MLAEVLFPEVKLDGRSSVPGMFSQKRTPSRQCRHCCVKHHSFVTDSGDSQPTWLCWAAPHRPNSALNAPL